MTPNDRQNRPRAAGNEARRPAVSRRRRRQRARRRQRIAAIAAIVTLAVGLAGLGAWRLLDRLSGATIRHYPMAYEALIRDCSAQADIPPALAAAVILAESGYRPDAVSSANAQGLMQLLPSTAEWIAEKFGEAYAEGCLFDPPVNVRYGCWYLGFLLRRYGGDMTCAAAAYHAGQGTVDRWLQDPACSADGAALDAIPYDTTRIYVRKVLQYYEKYEQLYAQSAPGA